MKAHTTKGPKGERRRCRRKEEDKAGKFHNCSHRCLLKHTAPDNRDPAPTPQQPLSPVREPRNLPNSWLCGSCRTAGRS